MWPISLALLSLGDPDPEWERGPLCSNYKTHTCCSDSDRSGLSQQWAKEWNETWRHKLSVVRAATQGSRHQGSKESKEVRVISNLTPWKASFSTQEMLRKHFQSRLHTNFWNPLWVPKKKVVPIFEGTKILLTVKNSNVYF